ncbi:MAG TPA: Rpn family recombination-promoting nuclease/putative transposase [Skermanella sp.]|jgi:predicted transposase YdaD|nr:Rpn family recombination-promoting nuclease/putative transposase [Skermanella sp.]
MTQQHDLLFRALVDDVGRAAVLTRDYLPEAIACRLSDELPVLLDGSFVDNTLTPSWTDRLFSVSLRDGGSILVYILLEHKSYPDAKTPLQVLGYMVEIWQRLVARDPSMMRSLPPIVPLVFYHGRSGWKVPTSIVDCLDADHGLAEYLRDLRYYVRNIAHIPDGELSADPEVRSGLLSLKHVYRGGLDPEPLLQTILSGLRDGSPFEEQVIRYMLEMYPLITIDLLVRVTRRVKPHRERDMVSLAAQEWIRQGRAEGIAEGIAKGEARGEAKGEVKGKIEGILIALEARFGSVPADVEARVRQAAPEKLNDLLKRACTTPSPDALFSEESRH